MSPTLERVDLCTRFLVGPRDTIPCAYQNQVVKQCVLSSCLWGVTAEGAVGTVLARSCHSGSGWNVPDSSLREGGGRTS